MPQRVVDVLESVQVHEHHRKLLAFAACQRNRLGKPVVQQNAIGQTGENIVMGQMIQLDVSRLNLFGQFVRFDRRNDQVRVRLLQPRHLDRSDAVCSRLCRANFLFPRGGAPFAYMGFAFACLRHVLTLTGRVFALMRGIFACAAVCSRPCDGPRVGTRCAIHDAACRCRGRSGTRSA